MAQVQNLEMSQAANAIRQARELAMAQIQVPEVSQAADVIGHDVTQTQMR